MTTSTIVGMFDEASRARAAASELANLGVSDANITVTQRDHNNGYLAYQGIGHVRVERRPASRDVTTQDLDDMQERPGVAL